MTVWDLLVMLVAATITAFPLCKIAKKAGFNADWWVMMVLILIPVLQLPYAYYVALKDWEK